MSIATETSTNHVKSLNGASEAAYRQAADAVLRGLGADGGFGLSEAEARARLEKHGRNELTTEEPVPTWRKFLAQFQDVLFTGDPDPLDQSGYRWRAGARAGVDPADPGLMNQPPRPRGEGVITRSMWRGIFFVGAIMATETLIVLNASLAGGLIEGAGNMRYAQTMAFTTTCLIASETIEGDGGNREKWHGDLTELASAGRK